MNSLPIKMLKDESGNTFIPLASTLGISSNGKMLNEEITDILNRMVGLDYVPARLDIVTSTDETGPSFEEINCSVVILEFGKMTTGESLINFGDYELKTNSVNSENFTFELTNGTTSYTSNYIDKDVIFDMYNRLIFSFNGTSWMVGINGISGGIISAPGIQGIPCEGLSISSGRDFALFRLYISTSLITGLDVIGASSLDFDIDRKVRPYACFMYYRNLTNNTLKNEGVGTESLDWTISQGTWVPGYNLIEGLSYLGLSQKPSINGVTLVGNKTTEDLLIESGGGVTDGDKGDITVSDSGATWTVDNNAVSNNKFRQSAGYSVVGKTGTGTGDVADIVAAENTVLRRNGTGDLMFGTIVTANITNYAVNAAKIADTAIVTQKIADANVTNAKLANMAANTIKGRAGTEGEVTDLTATQVRTILNIADGANNYSLPIATTSVLGGVKPDGSTITVDGNGVISSSGGGGYAAIEVTVDTAYSTAAKIGTTSSGVYVPTTGDVLIVTFTQGCYASSPTLNIDGSGAKNIRLGNNNVSTTYVSTTSQLTLQMWYDGTYYQIYGSLNNTNTTYDTIMDTNLYFYGLELGEQVTRCKIVWEGMDGKYYPTTIGDTTATTKTISTVPFKPGGNIYYNDSGSSYAAGYPFTRSFKNQKADVLLNSGIGYALNIDEAWTIGRALYFKGIIDANGGFVLDQAESVTTTLPTTEDGFVYRPFGTKAGLSGTTQYWNIIPNPTCIQYVGGKIVPYGYSSGDNVELNSITVGQNLSSRTLVFNFPENDFIDVSGDWTITKTVQCGANNWIEYELYHVTAIAEVEEIRIVYGGNVIDTIFAHSNGGGTYINKRNFILPNDFGTVTAVSEDGVGEMVNKLIKLLPFNSGNVMSSDESVKDFLTVTPEYLEYLKENNLLIPGQVFHVLDSADTANVIDELYYKPGDKINFDFNFAVGALITASTKILYFTIITPKKLTNISSITCNSLRAEIRGISGYLNSASGYNEYVGTTGYTVNCTKSSDCSITVYIQKSSAWTNVTNNTPVALIFNNLTEFQLS